MPEVDKYAATRCGPGTIRDPLDTAGHADDDASDEISDASSIEGLTEHAAGDVWQAVLDNLFRRRLIRNSISVKRLLAWIQHLHQTLYNMWPLSKLNWIWCRMP